MSLKERAEADPAEEGRAALRDMDATFAAGDADAFGGLFADDGRLLLLYREPLIGRARITAFWREAFERFDTSAWRTDHGLIEAHSQQAYAFSTYTETLVPRHAGPSQLVVGRLVSFWRRTSSEGWRIALLMNSHVRPIEEAT